jgi:hypothetical protein
MLAVAAAVGPAKPNGWAANATIWGSKSSSIATSRSTHDS